MIYVADAPMGTGKTISAINFINKSGDDAKFLYITPFLAEVDRIIKGCPDKGFIEPKVHGTKLNGIKGLLRDGKNVASTHSLFRLFDQEIADIIKSLNYILILDEVCDVITPLDITTCDEEIISDSIRAKENGVVEWIDSNYTGKFNEYKRICDLGNVRVYNDKKLVWLFPINVFYAFKTIYILTYLFDAQFQKYYFDFYGLSYTRLYIKGDSLETFEFTRDVVDYTSICRAFKDLIHICDNRRLNAIGDDSFTLSANWYSNHQGTLLMKQLKNNTRNFFAHYTKTKTQDNIWTTFKDFRMVLSGKGYTKGFLSCNTRATNEYRDRTAIAYLINRYFRPCITGFFTTNGIAVDLDMCALSELLQFIFRSAVRDGEEIWIYIPSRRMRELLVKWLNSFDHTDSNSS